MLVFNAVPASIVGYRLKHSLLLSASSMPPLGFQSATHGINLPYEHTNNTNFKLNNEQNRRLGYVYPQRAGNPLLHVLLCFDGNYNHANSLRNERGRN